MQEQLFKLVNELKLLPSETEWVEFKMNDQEPQEIGEYISALANSACLHDKDSGYLIFGIDDISHEIKGTQFHPRVVKIGNQEIENWLATQLDPRIDFKIFEFEYQGKYIAIFKIDPARHIPVKFRGMEYIRVGSYKKKLADHPEKARRIWQKTSGKTFEQGIALRKIDADKVLELLDYPAYFSLMKQNLPENKSAVLQKLEEEKLIMREDTHYNVTNLGGILFAKNLSNFDSLSRKAMRVVIYKGKNRLNTIKEQLGTKGYAAGFEGLINYVNDQLPMNEEIGKVFRKEVKMYPEIAVRELIANALIHQDFHETGNGPLIEIFDDRIEITNPGKPLISTLRFIDHSPQSRNERLAYFMRRINICEERGSGIDKVISYIEAYQLPAPNFIEDVNFLKVIIYSHKTLRQMDRYDKTRACYQHCCLKYVSNEIMTNQTLRERFKVEEKNYATISRIIGDTIKAKLIKDYDPNNKSRKYAKYIPIWA